MKRIVIAQRGWVFVGEVTEKDSHLTIKNCRNIRRWGTTKGLGELIEGPTKATILDEMGTVTLHELSVVAQIDVNGKKW